MSQTELAEKSGFRPSAISHFETGRREPSAKSLVKLADALGVNADYLLGRCGESEPVGPQVLRLLSGFGKLSAVKRGDVIRFVEIIGANK